MSIRVNRSQNNPGGDWGAEDELSALFAAYREACPEVEASANFLPGIWQKIEGRQSFWFSFEHLARTFAAVAVAMCLLLAALNVRASRNAVPAAVGYVDALAAEHSAEGTYFLEDARSTAQPEPGAADIRR